MPQTPSTNQLLSQAGQLFASGDIERATAFCRAALKQSPDNLHGLHLLAACRMSIGDAAGAETALARAVSLAPREPDLLIGHASALVRLGRNEEANAAIDRALTLRPADPNASALKAESLFRQRRFDEAAAILSPFVDARPAHLGLALTLATLCQRVPMHEQAAAMIRSCLDSPALPPPERVRALFALAEIYDAQDRFDDAFGACQQANALKAPRPDVPAYLASLEAMLNAWTPDVVGALPKATYETQLPIYIVGMPRSGTSLVEQLLASHPQVHGGGERQDISRIVAELEAGRPGGFPYHLRHPEALTRKSIDRSARKVADALRALDVRAERVTDKNPDNYLHLGVISTLFPKAHIIHCVREPLDTCLSCYLNNIGRRGPVGFSLHAFADSLPDIGKWHRRYERVMAHWRAVLPLNMLDVRYEDLVTDFEKHARRIIEFVGLPWDDACLRFHENARLVFTPSIDQVRRPVYASSVGRWKNYEKHLAPLRDALSAPA